MFDSDADRTQLRQRPSRSPSLTSSKPAAPLDGHRSKDHKSETTDSDTDILECTTAPEEPLRTEELDGDVTMHDVPASSTNPIDPVGFYGDTPPRIRKLTHSRPPPTHSRPPQFPKRGRKEPEADAGSESEEVQVYSASPTKPVDPVSFYARAPPRQDRKKPTHSRPPQFHKGGLGETDKSVEANSEDPHVYFIFGVLLFGCA